MIMKLSKEEKAEGITKELIDFVANEKSRTPIQLQQGDEPQNVLKCSTGYWVVLEPGKYLKDENNKMMVFSDRDCIVGRARYLLNFGNIEKEKKIIALVESWKTQCREKLDELKKAINKLKLNQGDETDTFVSSILKMYQRERPAEYEAERLFSEATLAKELPKYENAEALYAAGDFQQLIPILGIREFPALMLSAHKDISSDMKVLINTFSKEAIDKWDGDMVYKYAQIEIEKEYSY